MPMTSFDGKEMRRMMALTDPDQLHKLSEKILNDVVNNGENLVGTAEAPQVITMAFAMAAYVEARAAYLQAQLR